jgi:hypothetical protein
LSTSREHSFPRAEPRVAQAIALGVVLLTISWALLHTGFWDRTQIIDTPTYQRYGDAVLDGQVPYRDFDLEYPPAALPAFVVPALAREDDYSSAFELLMWACAVAAVVALGFALAAVDASPARLYAAIAFFALAPLALGTVILSRFDFWPGALTIGAVAAFVGRRERLGFGVLGLAVAAKIYPRVLLPLALVWTARRRGTRELWIGLGCFVGVLAVCFVPFLILSPGGVAHSFGTQLGRPLQIESLGASLLLAAHQLWGLNLTEVSSHGSDNLSGRVPDLLAGFQSFLMPATIAAAKDCWPVRLPRSLRSSRSARCSRPSSSSGSCRSRPRSPERAGWLRAAFFSSPWSRLNSGSRSATGTSSRSSRSAGS